MTSVGGNLQTALQVAQQMPLRLTVGQTVKAEVLGPTRHGLMVSIGRETFQLRVPSSLADAGTLTLKGTASTSGSGQPVSTSVHQVQITARDDRPLSRPIEAQLVAGVQSSRPNPSTIVQKNAIEVAASPVDSDGAVTGPRTTLHLQMQSLETNAGVQAKQAKSVSEERPQPAPGSSYRGSADISRSDASPKPSAHQSGANAVHDRGLEVSIRKLEPNTGEQGLKAALPPASSGAPSRSVDPAFITERSAGAAQPHGDQPRQQVAAAGSIQPSGREAAVLRSTMISANMTYREEAVVEAGASIRKPHSGEPLTTSGRHEAVTASVIGRTSAGNVLVDAGGQFMRIEQPVDLPIGTTLQVSFASGMSAGAAPIDRLAPPNPATLLDRLIGLLDAIDQSARQTVEAGQQAPTRRLPVPDRHLASSLLGLLISDPGGQQLPEEGASSSSRQGGAVSAQGDQIKALVRELGSMASESLADGWKSLTLPIGSDQNQAVSLYFRDHDLDPDDGTSEDGADDRTTQRAVFDVSFSQIGRCQIDALCQERRFDLLVRSEAPFGPEDRQDVAAIFVSTCEIAGINGEIGFNVGSFFEPVRSSSASTELRT